MPIAAPFSAPANTLRTPPKPHAPPTLSSSTSLAGPVRRRRRRICRRRDPPYEEDASTPRDGGELMTSCGRMLRTGRSSTITAFSTATAVNSSSTAAATPSSTTTTTTNTLRSRSSSRRRGVQEHLGFPLGAARAKSASFFSSRVVALLILGVVSYVAGEQCVVETCTDNSFNDHPAEGETLAYCLALHKYKECLAKLKRHCFSDLAHRAAELMAETKYNDYNCERILGSGSGPSATLASSSSVPPFDQAACSYQGSPAVSHCWLFGDPHLRTFEGSVMTCRVMGAWPLVDNNHLAIQVTNEAVPPQLLATATTKVTVIIRDHAPCNSERTYEASSESLPKAFVDGTTWSGASKTDPVVFVEEVDSGSHVVIHARHVNATVTIRKVAGYLTVLTVLPKTLAQEAADGIELCSRGCDEEERVQAPNQREMPWEEAERKCREYNLTAHYLDACVFDLITTGQVDFRLPAHLALRDVWLLDPVGAMSLSNRTVAISSAGGRPRGPPLTLLLASLLAAATWGGTRAAGGQIQTMTSLMMTSLWAVTSLVASLAGGR